MQQTPVPLPRRPLRRREYELLGRQGAFDDEKVELLDGQIVYAAEEGPSHAAVCARLNRLLVEGIPGAIGEVRPGNPFALSDLSSPEPDLLVTDPRYSSRDGHPQTAGLVVEVSESGRGRDLGIKASLYAAAGVIDYWVIDLLRDLIVVHRDPDGLTFRTVTSHDAGILYPLRYPAVAVDVATLRR